MPGGLLQSDGASLTNPPSPSHPVRPLSNIYVMIKTEHEQATMMSEQVRSYEWERAGQSWF